MGASGGCCADFVRELRDESGCRSWPASALSTPLRFVVLGFWPPALILFSLVREPTAFVKDGVVRPTSLQRACVENKSPLGDAALVEQNRRA